MSNKALTVEYANTRIAVLILLAILCLYYSNAQATLRIEGGVLLDSDSENLGLLLNIEPKVKVSESTSLGLRFGIAINPQKLQITDSDYFIDELDDNGIISFIPALDYYLNDRNYRPYLGIGLGFYLFNDLDILNRNTSENVSVLNGRVKNQLGVLFRAGFEKGTIRLGLEYNLIPKADIQIPKGQNVGTIDNSYLGLSFGYSVFGGRN